MKASVINLNSKQLKIFDYNGGDKGTVVGIHGLTGNGLQLRYFAEHLMAEGYRVITLDLRGRGDSSEGEDPSSIFSHVEDIEELIQELELDNVILMGYSMGGFISAILAAELDNVSKVILLDGAATMTDHQRPIVEPGLGRLSKAFASQAEYVDQVASGYVSFGIPTTDKLVEVLKYEIQDEGSHWENKGSEKTVTEDWHTFWDFDIKKYADDIDVPVLLIICEGEIGSNPPLFLEEHHEDTIEYVKDIEVVRTEANHYTLVFTEREDVIKAIDKFL